MTGGSCTTDNALNVGGGMEGLSHREEWEESCDMGCLLWRKVELSVRTAVLCHCTHFFQLQNLHNNVRELVS